MIDNIHKIYKYIIIHIIELYGFVKFCLPTLKKRAYLSLEIFINLTITFPIQIIFFLSKNELFSIHHYCICWHRSSNCCQQRSAGEQ